MQKYFILDNGGISFYVEIDKGIISIFTEPKFVSKSHKEAKKNPHKYFTKLVKTIKKYEKIFTNGRNSNSLLIKIKSGVYLYIGWKIEKLYIKEEIIKYYSPIGYPYAVGEKNTYLMIEKFFINNLSYTTDPYKAFYFDNVKHFNYKKKTIIDRVI
jgi:hypothetical protein